MIAVTESVHRRVHVGECISIRSAEIGACTATGKVGKGCTCLHAIATYVWVCLRNRLSYWEIPNNGLLGVAMDRL